LSPRQRRFRTTSISGLCLAAACSIDARRVTVNDSQQVAPTMICQGLPVQRDLITDFSDAFEVPDHDGKPGVGFAQGPVPGGGVSQLFTAPGLASAQLSLEPRGDNHALRIDANPGVPIGDDNYYVGMALGFGGDQEICVDASGYQGVSFTLDGSTGSCQLMFQVMISQDYRIGSNTLVASCTLGEACYPPFSRPLVVDGTMSYSIPFSALANGNPVGTVDVKAITNVGWKLFAPLNGPPCQASLLLDDVAFFR
jgi:hypothetical protein